MSIKNGSYGWEGIIRVLPRLKLISLLPIAFGAMYFLYSVANRSDTLVHAQSNSPAAYGQIDRQRLLNADKHPEDWLTTGRDFGKSHYSPLTQINEQTVDRLGFAWDYDTHTNRGLEATPIVVDGVMYTSGVAGRAYALDAKTGKELWHFDPKNNLQINRWVCCDEDNRGVAVWKGKVYVGSLDGRLFALNAATGAVEWQVDAVVDKAGGYPIVGAPEIAGGVVVIGNAGSDANARGYISAYDLNTGKLAWRFYTVPGDPSKPFENPELKMASKTWDPKSRWDMGGGGNVWNGMTYDPELNLLYFGTANGTYSDESERSPSGGDNLFICSIIAVNPDTGRMVWYYQETPGDQWDYDANPNIMLSNLKMGGGVSKVLMQASKNGFYYILDRKTGKLLSAEKIVPVNWADHVDLKTGRPVESKEARDFKNFRDGSVLAMPGPGGAVSWHAMAYDPKTGLVYLPVYESTLKNFYPAGNTILRAWDPIRNKIVWDVSTPGGWTRSGTLATGGGLVIQGTMFGHIRAFDAETGKLLKDIDVGTSINAAPMTYSIDGEQYVAVMAAYGGGGWQNVREGSAAYDRVNEGRIIAFKLDGGPTPKPALLPPIQPIPQPPPLTASAETVQRGAKLFANYNCGRCHAFSPRSIDLRRLVPGLTPDVFHKILLGGLLVNEGMPSFGLPAKSPDYQGDGVISSDEADAIYAYLMSLSWDGYKAQQAKSSQTDLPKETESH